MKILIVGLGYVGASTAVLLSEKNQVEAMDPDTEKTQAVNQGHAPLIDVEMEAIFQAKGLSIESCNNMQSVSKDADYVVIAVPTDWCPETESIDTRHIETVARMLDQSQSTAAIVIRSTVPVGFTKKLSEQYPNRTFIYCPEFLREGTAMRDVLYPQRIVIGCSQSCEDSMHHAKTFAQLLNDGIRSLRPFDYSEVPILFMETDEAEAVKLFSNTYLATRVAFFNELDSFAEKSGMDAGKIILGICTDNRIGDQYNNPGFGYGGYCLPKDSRQLLKDTESPANSLLHAVVESNEQRKKLMAERLLKAAQDTKESLAQGALPIIGIYRLTAKAGSDDIRSASILDIIVHLVMEDVTIVIYEPTVHDKAILEKWVSPSIMEKLKLENDLNTFKSKCHIIAANRWDDVLEDVKDKVYTRDIFGRN